MFRREHMDLELPTTVVIVEKESTVLNNLDLMLIKKFQKDKKQFQDHMEVSYVQAVSNPE